MSRINMSGSAAIIATVIAVAPVIGCHDWITAAPIAKCARAARLSSAALASPVWNEVTRNMVIRYSTDPSARPYALVSLAQHAAVLAAEERSASVCPSDRAAVAAASAAVLTYLYPTESASLAQQLRDQQTADAGTGATGLDAGEELGNQAASLVIALARTDGADAPWTGTVPTGPGFWFSSSKPPAPPATPMLGQMRPWVLTSGSQLRPAAPPAFGSAAFAQALGEVKAVSVGRTAEQTQIAQKWALSGGTYRAQGHWNIVAGDLAAANALRERDATHVYALLNVAMNDASIACFDAKYTYWLLRPSQADPTITLAIGLPNHPSYPSSHSCTSGAGAQVLGAMFPSDAARLDAMADEIGISRLYAGIHYRFDIDTGLSLGHAVAQLTLQLDRERGIATVTR